MAAPQFLSKCLCVASLSAIVISSGWAQSAKPVPAAVGSTVDDAQRTALAEAEGLEKLAAQHTKDGKHEAALPLRINALAALESVFGIDHPEIVGSIHLLAATYQDLRQMDKNLPLEIRALTIREKHLGLDHPEVARDRVP